MVKEANLRKKYIKYLKNLVCNDNFNGDCYTKLFDLLFDFRFDAVMFMDENRIADAIDMRADFEKNNGYYEPIISNPVSVLEVMVALAVRCEDSIMGNDLYGDRTPEWFWYMVKSLGLEDENDGKFDEFRAADILENLVNRTYKRDGEGSLFYIPGCRKDLRKVEIWYQMNWWLDTIDD